MNMVMNKQKIPHHYHIQKCNPIQANNKHALKKILVLDLQFSVALVYSSHIFDFLLLITMIYPNDGIFINLKFK